MATCLVVSEIRDNQLKNVNWEAFTAARQLAEQLGLTPAAVLLGSGVEGLAEAPARYGMERTYVVDDARLANYSGDCYAAAVAEVARQTEAQVVLMAATAMGKDLLPRVAYRLGTTTAQDVIQFRVENGEVIFTRPMFAGKVWAEVKVTGSPVVATLRPKMFAPEEKAVAGQVEKLSVELPEPLAVVEEVKASGGGKLDVTEADIVVSGGRGLKGPENWHLIEELAELLGAATGASRAVVDAGWRPHGEQVGQTGKTVAPTLYIAIGISGAIQHQAGMSSSKYIVAINKDPDAPIFKIADYGIVGDLFEVVPALIEEIKKLKQQD
ncbi:MAG: electron transfer flavoprotein subunit alpha/FixB family protein [Calditrichaeota bacterium]|nr:MAG: electron transfer flavoprotein subunit alpha/FixB family protein [Calditrichota bacterium]